MERSDYLKNGLHYHVKNLFPYCRSITGEGIRKTLSYFEKYNKDFKRLKFKTGLKILDWEVPEEWHIKDSYIQHLESGIKFAEFKKNNLHLVGYSEPIDKVLDLKNLLSNIHFSKVNDSYIPYVTSYYKKNWGFCLSKKEVQNLPEGKYKVFIDSYFKKGYLELSHALLKGTSDKEILFSSYVCHPSMANNELSGPVVLNAVMDYLKNNYKKRKFSYRFLLIPETIGSIAYISKYKKKLKKNVICGFNLSCVGDEKAFSYISSPFKNTLADKSIKAALIGKDNVKEYSFLQRGSDERQFCSPGLRLPLCTFSRSKFGDYPEYHTSADNLNLVTDKGLYDSFKIIKSIIDSFELGLYPKASFIGEPQLGKRGLYPNISLVRDTNPASLRMDFLAYADGNTSLFDIANITNYPLSDIIDECKKLQKYRLVQC